MMAHVIFNLHTNMKDGTGTDEIPPMVRKEQKGNSFTKPPLSLKSSESSYILKERLLISPRRAFHSFLFF